MRPTLFLVITCFLLLVLGFMVAPHMQIVIDMAAMTPHVQYPRALSSLITPAAMSPHS